MEELAVEGLVVVEGEKEEEDEEDGQMIVRVSG